MRVYTCMLIFALCACTHAFAKTQARGETTVTRSGTVSLDSVCVVTGDGLAMVPITISSSGDTLVDGTDFHIAYPTEAPPYAESAEWFVSGRPIQFAGHLYFKYGLPRKVSPFELRRVGKYSEILLFEIATEDGSPPDVLLLPMRPGCIFQLYSSAG